MDRIWRSGIIAGATGVVITLLNLIVLGSWFTVFTEQTGILLLLLLLANLLAFVVAGIVSGILVRPYAKSEIESLKSGAIAGCIVAVSPILLIVILAAVGVFKFEEAHFLWAILLGGLVFLLVLISQVSLAGLISLVYVRYVRKRQAGEAPAEEGGLGDLKALYDDLWKDARTLAVDMNRSILLYLLAGCLMLAYGIVILAYAAISWQHISSGSGSLADYSAAVGGTIAGIIQLIVGPLLVYWYLKLKSRYSRLASIEKGDVR